MKYTTKAMSGSHRKVNNEPLGVHKQIDKKEEEKTA